jgi:hypothetical protein
MENNTRHQESLENPLDIDIKVGNIILDDENVSLHVSLRSKIFISLKKKLSYVYNNLINWIACTTKNTVCVADFENPTKNDQSAFVEIKQTQQQAAVEEPSPETQLVVEEPTYSLQEILEPVVVEKPISFEERI